MATDKVRAVLDSLGAVSAQARERLTRAGEAASTAPNPLGLRFTDGTRVLDLTTGQRGRVQFGQRDAQTNTEVFRVQLADARVVWRTRDELELDRAS